MSWISMSDVVQLMGKTERHILRQVASGEIVARDSKQKSRNGKTHREYSVASLPGEAQRRFLELSLARAATATTRELAGGSALQRFEAAGQPSGRSSAPAGDALQRGIFDSLPALADAHRVILPPEFEKQASERYRAIAPLLEYGKGSRQFPVQVGDRTIASLNHLADWLAQQNNTSARTLWRWYARFKQHGYAALADRARSDKNRSRYFEAHQPIAEFAQKKYLAERLSISVVHEAIQRKCREHGLDAPDYKTVRLYLQSLPKALQIISREGERQYHDRCEMFVVKQYTDRLANDVWVSDHMIHDVWVRNDGLFSDHPRDAAIRPWLTAIIDYRSRKALGYVWCATPSSDTISAALRIALSKYGPPQTFYIDNGKDYRSLARENALSPQASGVLVRLGVESQYCQPRHPQSKHIERWFNTIHQRFDIQWRPFYSGTSPKDRPEECDKILADHKKLMKTGKVAESLLPLASEFVQMAAYWIAENYNANHAHGGRGMDGKTPDEIFNAEYPEGQRRACDPRALDVLLRRREVRKVREGGCIEINGNRYEPADAASSAALTLEIEHDILIACDPANMGEAVALDLDGHYLGTVQASRLMEHGPVSREAIRDSIRQRRQVRKALKGYVGGLIERSYGRGEQSEMEILRDRAGLGPVERVQHARALPAVAASIGRAAAAPIGYDRVADKFFEEEN